MPEYKITVDGMTCGHCEAAVTQALQDLAGVQRVEVDLDKGEATVETEARVEPEQLLASVREEGYEATLQ